VTRLAVVIVNYRTPGLVIDALTSLQGELDPDRDVAVVVDNASRDDSVELITESIERRGWTSWVKLVKSTVNGGFSAGNNAGIREVDADFYLLLNSDAYVRPEAIQTLLECARREPEAGLLSPRLEWPDGRPQISCFRWHTPLTELILAAGTGPITQLFRRHDVPQALESTPSWPQWTSFACVLIRRAVLQDLGPMDEGYFMYFDDVDYCRRAASKGWRVLNCPSARVVHLRGGTSPMKKAAAERRRLPAYYYNSRSRYYAKFYGLPGLWLANALWIVGWLIAGLRETIGQKEPHAAKSAWRDIWIGSVPVSHSGSSAGEMSQ